MKTEAIRKNLRRILHLALILSLIAIPGRGQLGSKPSSSGSKNKKSVVGSVTQVLSNAPGFSQLPLNFDPNLGNLLAVQLKINLQKQLSFNAENKNIAPVTAEVSLSYGVRWSAQTGLNQQIVGVGKTTISGPGASGLSCSGPDLVPSGLIVGQTFVQSYTPNNWLGFGSGISDFTSINKGPFDFCDLQVIGELWTMTVIYWFES